MYFKIITFPSSCRRTGGFLSDSHFENLVELIVKTHILWVPPPPLNVCCLGVFKLRLSTLNLQQFFSYSPGFPASALVPAEASLIPMQGSGPGFLLWKPWLHIQPVCLSNLGGSGLPSDFTSLMDLRRVVDFLVCIAFFLLLRRMMTSKLLTYQTRNQKSLLLPKNLTLPVLSFL